MTSSQRTREPNSILVSGLILLIMIVATGAAISYREFNSRITVRPPVVWFEDPLYPGVIVTLHNYKSRAIVDVNATGVKARLINRSGAWYDLRDPSTVYMYFEEWGRGCEYTITPNGTLISVTGNPLGGLYGGCVFRYRYPLDVVNLTVAFTLKTDDTSPLDGIRGVIIANNVSGYYYTMGIKNNASGWFFGIYKYNGTTIREPGGPGLPPLRDIMITGRIQGIWFDIVAIFIVYPNGTMGVSSWLYNATAGGTLVASLSSIDPWPIQGLNTFGIGVYQIRNQPSAVFQMIGVTRYNYITLIRGLSYCCHVYVYDSAGVLIGQKHVNETGIVEIPLDVPAPGDSYLQVTCGNYSYNISLENLLGGDVYEIYFYFYGPVLNIFGNAGSFTGWLSTMRINCTDRIYYVEIGLANSTYVTSQNITITSYMGTIITIYEDTEMIYFTPRVYGWAGNITLETEMYHNATCNIQLGFYYNFTSAFIGMNSVNLTIRAT